MGKEKQTDGYGERIRRAMELGPRPISSVRALAQRVEDSHKGLRGATYGGVRQYHAGDITNPRLELLKAIADVLAVRWQWLAYGDGAMTEAAAEARVTPLERDPEEVQRTREAVSAALFEAMPALRPRGTFGVDAIALACVPPVAEWIGKNGLNLVPEEEDHARYTMAGRLLGEAIAAPLRELHLDAEGWPEAVKAQYVATLMSALVPLVDLSWTRTIRDRLATQEEENG